MPLQIQLIGTGPGRGLFEIAGTALDGDGFELAIQRNADDRYLGPGQVWQTTIHWHWCPLVDTDARPLRLAAGPEIVDGILGSALNALLVEIRGGNARDSGILRIRGLVGSTAGAEGLRTAAGPAPAALPTPHAEDRSEPVAAPPPRRTWLWASLIVAGLALGAVGIAWYWGLFDTPPVRDGAETARASAPADTQAPAQTTPTAELEPSAPVTVESDRPPSEVNMGTVEREPTLTGRAMVQQYLKGEPPALDLYTTAEARERTGDCEAAILLYERAASADPMTAARVAARYDPAGFEGSQCIESANRESALVWYEDAAKAGDVGAQMRLGQMLVEQTRSGINYEQGRDWLRKAAAGGDEQAQRILDGLDDRLRTSYDR